MFPKPLVENGRYVEKLAQAVLSNVCAGAEGSGYHELS